ncbi:MAG: glycosyl hydrolase [Novosphingobium sp.]
MIAKFISCSALAFALLATGCKAAPPALPAAEPAKLRLGVTAHFAQGWPEAIWPTLSTVHAGTVREALSWKRVESSLGKYSYNQQNAGHLDRLCALKLPVVLVVDPRNPLYDDGATADSPSAQAAFAAFIASVTGRYGDCLAAIEVGNEINGAKAINGLAAHDRAGSHTRLMKQVWQGTKLRHPRIALLGGSVNAVGEGFLEQFFARGLLDWVDGIAVHPYRRTSEGLQWELAGLRAAMARHGKIKPIWATEFGIATADTAKASDYLLSMAVLLSASGVHEAQWYALADDGPFPTMGLVQADAKAKPAATTFAMLVSDLLARGAAVPAEKGEPGLFRFRFGSDREVVWGAPRSIVFPESAIVRDSSGAPIEHPLRIGSSPIVVESSRELKLGTIEVLADSLYDYASHRWAYAAFREKSGETVLSMVPGKFAATLGAPQLGPVAVNPEGMVIPASRIPMTTELRYSVSNASQLVAQACLSPRSSQGGTVKFQISTNNKALPAMAVPPQGLKVTQEIDVAAGDRVSFVTTARGSPVVVGYRFRIALAGTLAALEPLSCS